jgi:RNA polymerase sigma-70 factor (ECF subfamily)
MNQTNQNTSIDHIFRHEYGKIIAVLVHKFGTHHLEKIEDVVQDAFLKAMNIWAYKEVPQNPTGWLLRVASNGLIDTFRKDKKLQESDSIEALLKDTQTDEKEISLNNVIQDSQLKMIFACCNPSLSSESQIILSLKLIGGFSNKEISRSLLKKEDAVAKSFTRAKQRFKKNIKTLEIPIEMGLSSRINIVLKVIYLLFSEGYTASSGENNIKRDICYEAIRLALLLTKQKASDISETHALIALMCFHTSRFDARTDEKNELVDLEHQDRKKYDVELIRFGLIHFHKANEKPHKNPLYFLQAAVSFHYSDATNFDEINWRNILKFYDLQLKYSPSPIIKLNSIVPFYKVHGPQKGLESLEEMNKENTLENNGLFHSIKAQLLQELQHFDEAKKSLKIAIELAYNEVQKKHLIKKLNNLN